MCVHWLASIDPGVSSRSATWANAGAASGSVEPCSKERSYFFPALFPVRSRDPVHGKPRRLEPAGLQALISALGGYRFRFAHERDLQDGITAVLTQAGIAFQRERALGPRDRPDFMTEDGIAVEIKIQGSRAQCLRQAARYASHPEVTAVLIVGTPHWLSSLSCVLDGKPVQSLRMLDSLI